jgi:hypothetical protein
MLLIPQFTIPHLKKIIRDIESNLMSDNILFFQFIYLTAFIKDKINIEINASVDVLAFFNSEMEYKENYRRVMAACVRKVCDNDNNIIHPGQRHPRC